MNGALPVVAVYSVALRGATVAAGRRYGGGNIRASSQLIRASVLRQASPLTAGSNRRNSARCGPMRTRTRSPDTGI